MITIRIPTEQYAYIELSYDTIEQYKKEYLDAVIAITEVKEKVNKWKKQQANPF